MQILVIIKSYSIIAVKITAVLTYCRGSQDNCNSFAYPCSPVDGNLIGIQQLVYIVVV